VLTDQNRFGITHISCSTEELSNKKKQGAEKKIKKVVDGSGKLEYSAESVATKSRKLGL
jgi:hypothetical protein